MMSTKSKDAKETTQDSRLRQSRVVTLGSLPMTQHMAQHMKRIFEMCSVVCCVMGKDPKVATL